MCLGVPGRIVAIDAAGALTMGSVSFGGIIKEVCLAYTPGVQVGDWVVVHVGFAITTIDEQEALAVFDYLYRIDELAELTVPQP